MIADTQAEAADSWGIKKKDRAKELCGLGSPVLYKEMVVSETKKEKDL